MTKTQALYKFYSAFGLSAYPSKPDDVVFPYLIYENVVGCQGDTISTTMTLWFHTTSEKAPNSKVEQIEAYIGRGGKQVPYDDGAIWIRRGSPWCTALTDDTDAQIKGRRLNLEIEFL